MSDRDTFLDEVTEEVRRDRLFRLWRRFGPYAVSVIFLLVAAFAVWEWLQASDEGNSRERMGAFLDILEDEEGVAETLEEWAADAPSGYAMLARFTAAARHVEDGNADQAAQLYGAIAEDESLDSLYRELARIKQVMAEAESLSAEELEVRLRPLTFEGNIFRDVARELLAGALLAKGDVPAAREILDALEEEGQLEEGGVSRVNALRELADMLDPVDESS